MKNFVKRPIPLTAHDVPIRGLWTVTYIDRSDNQQLYSYIAVNIVDVMTAINRTTCFKGFSKVELDGFYIGDSFFTMNDLVDCPYDLDVILYILN